MSVQDFREQENQKEGPFTVTEPGRTPGQAEGPNDPAYYTPSTTQSSVHEQTKVRGRSDQASGRQRSAEMSAVPSQLRELSKQVREEVQSFGQSSSTLNLAGITLPRDGIKYWASLISGSFLAIYGLRRSLGSLTLAGIGVGLVYYALTDEWPLSGQWRKNKTARKRWLGTTAGNGFTTTQSILVKGELSNIYQTWANFENFPRFMRHIKSVHKTGARTSHWMMEGPLSTTLEWDAETTRLEENKRIAWSSTDGDLKTSGQVTFNALPDREVEVTVVLRYVPPAGLIGEAITTLFDDPDEKLQQDLRNFKRYIEDQA
ncbi:MAG: SRPBCC family protein [Caldilineaceae bacterium]